MEVILSIIEGTPPLFLFIILLILVDAFTAFRYYYMDRLYEKTIGKLDSEILKFKRLVVIYGYSTLASQEVIDRALKDYRDLESQLGKPFYDFSKQKEEYLKKLKDASNRGYY